jgi:hypothetical protein
LTDFSESSLRSEISWLKEPYRTGRLGEPGLEASGVAIPELPLALTTRDLNGNSAGVGTLLSDCLAAEAAGAKISHSSPYHRRAKRAIYQSSIQ